LRAQAPLIDEHTRGIKRADHQVILVQIDARVQHDLLQDEGEPEV
jgi:hypothetical protein